MNDKEIKNMLVDDILTNNAYFYIENSLAHIKTKIQGVKTLNTGDILICFNDGILSLKHNSFIKVVKEESINKSFDYLYKVEYDDIFTACIGIKNKSNIINFPKT